MNGAEATELVELVVKLEPEVQTLIVKLIQALTAGDQQAAREAFEAAHYAAFVATLK